MIRLSRTRINDPCHMSDPMLSKWSAHDTPSLNEEFATLSVAELVEALPTCSERQKLLARDPLACADGFRVLCRLVFDRLFGIRFCTKCPDCNIAPKCCQDVFGSNATPEGGIFRRADAVYGSIECQKCGSLHLHAQVFIQCIHQHTPLREIMQLI